MAAPKSTIPNRDPARRVGVVTHGKYGTAAYRAWFSVKQRCFNPNRKDYVRYGGRGIVMCNRWKDSFAEFYADMGDRPSADHSIDRVDNSKGYNCGRCPDCERDGLSPNCVWADRMQQGRNKRNNRMLTSRGLTLTLAEWARELGLHPASLHERLDEGWSVDEALSLPRGSYRQERQGPRGSRQGRSKLVEADVPVIRQLLQDGQSQTEVAKRLGVGRTTIADIARGSTWSHVK